MILAWRGVGIIDWRGIELRGEAADEVECVAADEAADNVRERIDEDATGAGTEEGGAAEAERNIVLDGRRLKPGLGSPRQLVAVGGIGKSSLPNSSMPPATPPGSEEGVSGRLSGWDEGVRGRDWDETLVLSRVEYVD